MWLREGCPLGHAAAAHDGHDGLSSLRKTCKSASFDKRLCMINADLVAIGHVSGSHQLGPVLHEVITMSILGTWFKVSEKPVCVLSEHAAVVWDRLRWLRCAQLGGPGGPDASHSS